MSASKEALSFWADGLERGRKISALLEKEIGSLEGKKVLDLGCGLGGISISFKEKSAGVFSIDSDNERIIGLKKRLSESNIKGIFPLQADATDLPFLNDTFDLIIINGVLEWVGWGKDKNPLLLQYQVLGEAIRVLRKAGILYLAIENRFYPVNLFRDPHLKIPFVAMLPYEIASGFSYLMIGKPYQTPIYSYWRLKRMLREAGFAKISMYAGLLHYQYPVLSISLERECPRFLQKEDILKLIAEYKKFNLKKGLSAKILFLKIIFLLGLARIFVHSFIVLAEK